ncbi:MAG: hypothetical protein GX552_18455, partial [Chloroflexi bacterium]|nr:hypothetical protein [Chloroflexota bacterium]
MNDRERILTMFRGGVPDRVPWFGDLTYWAGAMERRGEVPRNWQSSESYYQFHRELGVGFYLQGYFAFRTVTDGDVEIEERTDERARWRQVRTPVGTLQEEWRFLPEAYAWAPVQRMIKTPADLPALRYWYEHRYYLPDEEEALRRRPLVDDLGVVLCYLPRSPFMELMAELAGIRNIVNIWMEAPDAFDETMEVLYASTDRAAEIATAVPADCLMIPENLSSEVVGVRFYERYVQPWEAKWT